MISVLFVNFAQVPVREAINQAIDEEMARDEKVFIMGMYLFVGKTR